VTIWVAWHRAGQRPWLRGREPPCPFAARVGETSDQSDQLRRRPLAHCAAALLRGTCSLALRETRVWARPMNRGPTLTFTHAGPTTPPHSKRRPYRPATGAGPRPRPSTSRLVLALWHGTRPTIASPSPHSTKQAAQVGDSGQAPPALSRNIGQHCLPARHTCRAGYQCGQFRSRPDHSPAPQKRVATRLQASRGVRGAPAGSDEDITSRSLSSSLSLQR